MRRQKAVYWPLASNDTGGVAYDDHGQLLFGAAVEIDCRWVDAVEQFVDADGTAHFSRSKVYADRDVDVHGMLLLSTLDTGMDTSDPKSIDGAYEILRFDKLPDFKAHEYLRTAYL